MKIECSAVTCVFNHDNECKADNITLVDFEYYKDVEGYRKGDTCDDMKCVTYKRDKSWI